MSWEYLTLLVTVIGTQIGMYVLIKSEMSEMKKELKYDIKSVRTEMSEMKKDLKDDIKSVRTEMFEMKKELKADIDKTQNMLWIAFSGHNPQNKIKDIEEG